MDIHAFDRAPGRAGMINGKEFLFFSGYDYLGMQHVPEFAVLVNEGIGLHGWVFPSSRISNTRLKIFEEAEALLSAITRMEDTVLLSSGFLAGRIATAPFRNNIINVSPSHPAIRRNGAHDDAGVIAFDSVETLQASVTDIAFLETGNNNKIVIIDDSHGIGLIGNNGEGIISRLPQHNYIKYILTYSLSKAFHIGGGAISCNKEMADQYRSHYGYTSATAPSPALLHAFIKGQHIFALQREKLRSNTQYFYSLIEDITGIYHHPELPIFVLPETVDERKLYDQQIIISSFSYPDANGKKITRIVLSALHTRKDLETLAACLHKIL